MRSRVWNESGEVIDAVDVTFVSKSGRVYGAPTVRKLAHTALRRLGYPLSQRGAILAHTLERIEWARWRNGMLPAAVVRDIVEWAHSFGGDA